jgi:hypothetical protein
MAGVSKQKSFRKAFGAIKDSTKVGLASINSTYKVGCHWELCPLVVHGLVSSMVHVQSS